MLEVEMGDPLEASFEALEREGDELEALKGEMSGEALGAAVVAALQALDGVGIYDGAPVQAAFPYAVVETGGESDWGHKSGVGREVRVAAVLRDQGERPVRLRRLAGEAEALIAGIAGPLDGWHLVSLTFVRSRVVKEARNWAASVEFRARMLAV